ncbi:hypothetical protein CDAR_112451 [Caerostris darwini]|uniref:Uncharacterized protein n=1 Tax=Caerostris darwini TaxID=1538125 RepID=A0AAV4PZG3_9ARAC|nr:hypothetical protein CDAR_112451 [Caerostris darwini]
MLIYGRWSLISERGGQPATIDDRERRSRALPLNSSIPCSVGADILLLRFAGHMKVAKYFTAVALRQRQLLHIASAYHLLPAFMASMFLHLGTGSGNLFIFSSSRARIRRARWRRNCRGTFIYLITKREKWESEEFRANCVSGTGTLQIEPRVPKSPGQERNNRTTVFHRSLGKTARCRATSNVHLWSFYSN